MSCRRKHRDARAAGTIGGRPVTELDTQGNWERSEVYANGSVIATYAADSTVYFDRTNWLGTVRQRATMSGGPYEACTSLPYGDDLACAGADPSPLHFTGQPRDTESGLDAFPFRYYNSGLAGWMTPDPAGLAAVNPMNPQSWNPYAYVDDNPMNATDPLGLSVCQGAPLPGEPIPDGPVQFNCPSQGFVGGYLMQTFTVSATPEAAPAPMWEMACGPGCISGALGGAAAALQAAVNSFVDEMSYHPNSPGAGGGGGAGGGSITTSLTISGPANGDVPLNPRAQAIFSLVGQETGSLTNWKFWAGWEGASLAAGAAPSLGPLYDAAGELALSVEAAAPGTAASSSDFVDSMMPGSPPSPSWGGAAAMLVEWYMWLRCQAGGC